ncbi:hypothetical protein ACEXQB_010145 [Herbiconiux sp. P18]|uniref:hypothetical protein n=1 Tax=Herbiconiux liangxiaofengii TaxID=3342795 RepID=UPI0035B81AE4
MPGTETPGDCNNVYECVDCTHDVQRVRTDTLATALDAAPTAAHVVFTQNHRLGEDLDQLWDDLTDASSRLTAGGWWQTVKSEYDIALPVRSVEFTYGHHGWHAHVHAVILFHRKLSTAEHEEIHKALRKRWGQVSAHRGRQAEHVDYTPYRGGSWRMARYLFKEHPRDHRRSPEDSLTVGDILGLAATGDAEAERLYLEFSAAQHDRQATSSRGIDAYVAERAPHVGPRLDPMFYPPARAQIEC